MKNYHISGINSQLVHDLTHHPHKRLTLKELGDLLNFNTDTYYKQTQVHLGSITLSARQLLLKLHTDEKP